MNNTIDQFVERFHEYAAKGNVDLVKGITEGLGDVNAKNGFGWTALMFAARNNQAPVVKALLEKNCDATIINSSGQTALDIAKFWNHVEVVRLLEPAPESESPMSGIVSRLPTVVNYFSHNPMDRAAHRRKDQSWLQEQMKADKTKYVLFHKLQPVVVQRSDNVTTTGTGRYSLCMFSYSECKDILGDNNATIVFLGQDQRGPFPANKQPVPHDDWPAVFAADISHFDEDKIDKLRPNAFSGPLIPVMMMLDKYEGGIVAQARSLLAWHERYQFCPTCGKQSTLDEGGYKRICIDETCKSRKGVHNTSYPRLDPTVIMAVISPDGRNILLGRGARFPKGMWSCLAGFVEPGESIEDACRREVEEESGIKIGRVDYHSCQPWPMPASLMIGCLAHAASMEIKVDREEIEEAKWYSRQDAVAMLNRKHQAGLFCPPQTAIAHQLIKAWVSMSSNL